MYMQLFSYLYVKASKNKVKYLRVAFNKVPDFFVHAFKIVVDS